MRANPTFAKSNYREMRVAARHVGRPLPSIVVESTSNASDDANIKGDSFTGGGGEGEKVEDAAARGDGRRMLRERRQKNELNRAVKEERRGRRRKADARGHDAADIASRNTKRAEISSRR